MCVCVCVYCDAMFMCIQVNVSSDGVVESEESFVVSLEVPATETGVNLQLNTTTVMLMDSDCEFNALAMPYTYTTSI